MICITIMIVLLLLHVDAFNIMSIRHAGKLCSDNNYHSLTRSIRFPTKINLDSNDVDNFFDDERVNEMAIDEIKAELDARSINYEDCFSKKELVKKLGQARREGKASPDIFNQFNEISNDNVETFDPTEVDDILSQDKRLPGGLDPSVMKLLGSDPEIMTMLRDPKMQEIMKAVMTGGPKGLQKYTSDPDSIKLLNLLTKAMERVMKNKM